MKRRLILKMVALSPFIVLVPELKAKEKLYNINDVEVFIAGKKIDSLTYFKIDSDINWEELWRIAK